MTREIRALFSFLRDTDKATFWDDVSVLYLHLGGELVEFMHFSKLIKLYINTSVKIKY